MKKILLLTISSFLLTISQGALAQIAMAKKAVEDAKVHAVLNPDWKLDNIDQVQTTKSKAKSGVYVLTAKIPDLEEAPALVFLKGWYPGVGSYGYKKLIEFIASQGIEVIHPMSPTDKLGETLNIQIWGLDSQEFAQEMFESIKDQIKGKEVYIYGHSLGTYTTNHMIDYMEKNDTTIKAIMLDGVFPQDGTVEDENAPDLLTKYEFPIYFVRFDGDTFCSESTKDTCFLSESQNTRLITIHSFTDKNDITYKADHFSPFTNDPLHYKSKDVLKLWNAKPRKFLRNQADKAAKNDIHGYDARLIEDFVDYYSTMAIIPALVFSQSDDLIKQQKSQDILEKPFKVDGQILRSIY